MSQTFEKLIALWRMLPFKTKLRILSALSVGSVLLHKRNAIARNAVNVYSRCVNAVAEDIPDTTRSQFRRMNFPPLRDVQDGHTHPTAAKQRSEGVALIDQFINIIGYTPFAIAASMYDKRTAGCGYGAYYTVKDLAYRNDPTRFYPTSEEAIKMIDVDYYMEDLEDYMAGNRQPILIWTFTPSSLTGSVPDGSYRITRDNKVVLTMSSGAVYEHKLWDWLKTAIITSPSNGDVHTAYGLIAGLAATTVTHCIGAAKALNWVSNLFWKPRVTIPLLSGLVTGLTTWATLRSVSTVYLLEHMVHPKDHTRMVILATPTRRIPTVLASWLPDAGKDGISRLRRREFCRPDGILEAQYIASNDGVQYPALSVSAEEGLSFDVPLEVEESCRLRAARSDNWAVTSIETIINAANSGRKFVEITKVVYGATLLSELFNTGYKPKQISGALHPAPGRYRATHLYVPNKKGSALLDDPKESMRDVLDVLPGKPWATSASSPARHVWSEESAIQGRVLNIVNTKALTTTDMHNATMFIKLLVRDRRHTLVPTSLDEVAERQPRPTQRAIFKRALTKLQPVKAVFQSFLKTEAYGAPNYPRVITTMPDAHKVRYSRYMYALATMLKTEQWYAFSKTPREIAERINALCSDPSVTHLMGTDFSKFDGHVSSALRDVERAFLCAAFPPEYHGEVVGLHALQQNATAFGAFGTRYNVGNSRLSGSPETSVMNSFINAFISFCMLRRLGHSPEMAYSRLGMYGGDDGITPDVMSEQLEDVSWATGMKMTTEIIHRGACVPFLGRFFVNPWVTGGVHSICDIIRQAQKLHLTTCKTESGEAVMVRKAEGFIRTDAQTPFIGPWAAERLKAGGSGSFRFDPLTHSWWAQYEDQFPQLDRATNMLFVAKIWPQYYLEIGTADSLVHLTFPKQTVINVKTEPKVDYVSTSCVVERSATVVEDASKGQQRIPSSTASKQPATSGGKHAGQGGRGKHIPAGQRPNTANRGDPRKGQRESSRVRQRPPSGAGPVKRKPPAASGDPGRAGHASSRASGVGGSPKIADPRPSGTPVN